MARKWTVRMLGELRVERGDRVVTRFRGRKAGALLARLAFPPVRAHPRERLIDLLWGDEALELANPRQSLSQEIYSLRNQFAEPDLPTARVIEASRDEVWLSPEVFDSDVEAFEAALEAADRATTGLERARRLEQAARLYRGELLPGAYDEWVLAERYRLAELRLGALRQLVALAESAGDAVGAIDHATAVVAADPLDEAMHRALIRLHAAAGRPGSAERQYAALVEILATELGVEPEAESTALMEAVRASAAAGGAREAGEMADDGGRGGEPTAELAGPATITALVVQMGERESTVATFGRASDAIAAAIDLADGEVRIGLATGEIGVGGGGLESNADRGERGVIEAASWLAIAARPGRIVASAATAALALRGDHHARLVDRGLWIIEGGRQPLHLFEVVAGDEGVHGPPVEGQRAALGRLPARFTHFFGREGERRALADLLAHPRRRLVTLLGPAGVGKTRLGLEVVEACLETFDGAVWLAPLADIENGALLPDLLAATLGLRVPPGGDPLDTVVDALSGRPSLILLDNAEHLVEALAPIARTLLERVPELTLFVTSQRRLGLHAEHVVPLAPLPVPDAIAAGDVGEAALAALREIPSVALFADRAREAFPEFRLAPRNAAAIAEICRRLDGIPLAIELAASRTAVLTPARLLEHLDDRFGLLVSRHRDSDPRHRTLASAIEWTVRLLDEPDRRVFAELSVFRGGFASEAVSAVCMSGAPSAAAGGEARPMVDALELVSRLVDASLVTVDAGTVERRFRMLDSLRAYGAGMLGPEATAALQTRHAAWILDLAERAEPHLSGSEQAAWLDRLDLERENLRAALDWCVETGEVDVGVRLAGALWRYWYLRGAAREGLGWLKLMLDESVLDESTLATPQAARAMHGFGTLAYMEAENDLARRWLTRCLHAQRDLGDAKGEAAALNNLGMVAQRASDVAEAARRYRQALDLKLTVSDARGALSSRINLATVALIGDDIETAGREAASAARDSSTLGDLWSRSRALTLLGHVAIAVGDAAEATRYFQECLGLQEAIGDRASTPTTLVGLASSRIRQDRRQEAAALIERADVVAGEHQDDTVRADILAARGELALVAGAPEKAVVHFSTCLAIQDRLNRSHHRATAELWLACAFVMLGDLESACGIVRRTLLTQGLPPRIVALAIDVVAMRSVAAESVVVAQDLFSRSSAIRKAAGLATPASLRRQRDAAMARAEIGAARRAVPEVTTEDLASPQAAIAAALRSIEP